MIKLTLTKFKSPSIRVTLTVIVIVIFLFLYQKNNAPIAKINVAKIAEGFIIANQGRDAIPACINCHGNQGQGDIINGTPRLAGLNADYIFKQLKDFSRDPLNTRVALDPITRDYQITPRVYVDLTVFTPGTRVHPAMNRIARLLSTEEKRQLANYFSLLSFKATPVPKDFGNRSQLIRNKPVFY